MRKGREEENGMKKKWKIMTFIVATNVVASRPPERRPTGTPHARANIFSINYQVLDISIGFGPYSPRLCEPALVTGLSPYHRGPTGP